MPLLFMAKKKLEGKKKGLEDGSMKTNGYNFYL